MHFLLDHRACEVAIFSEGKNEVETLALLLWVQIQLDVDQVTQNWSILLRDRATERMVQKTLHPEIADALGGVLDALHIAWDHLKLFIFLILHLDGPLVELLYEFFVQIKLAIYVLFSESVDLLVLLLEFDLKLTNAFLLLLVEVVDVLLNCFEGLESILQLCVHVCNVLRHFKLVFVVVILNVLSAKLGTELAHQFFHLWSVHQISC